MMMEKYHKYAEFLRCVPNIDSPGGALLSAWCIHLLHRNNGEQKLPAVVGLHTSKTFIEYSSNLKYLVGESKFAYNPDHVVLTYEHRSYFDIWGQVNIQDWDTKLKLPNKEIGNFSRKVLTFDSKVNTDLLSKYLTKIQTKFKVRLGLSIKAEKEKPEEYIIDEYPVESWGYKNWHIRIKGGVGSTMTDIMDDDSNFFPSVEIAEKVIKARGGILTKVNRWESL